MTSAAYDALTMSQENAKTLIQRVPAAVWLVLASVAFFVPAVMSASRKSATFDEPVYIIAGLSYLTLHDFTMKEDAPPLVATLSGLSPLIHGLTIPGSKLPFRDSLGHEYPYSLDRLYRSGIDADKVLLYGRMMVLFPFGLLLLFSVYFWSRSLFGASAGILSLFLTALSPNLIAHGRIIAADFPSSSTLVFASFMLWRSLKAPGDKRRAITVGLALGLALITKFTMLLLVPTFVIIWVVAAFRDRTLPKTAWLTSASIAALSAGLVVSIAYGFPPSPVPYLDGVQTIYKNVLPKNYPWYFFGSFYPGGVWHYYLSVLAVKASVPLLLLGLSSWLFIKKRGTGLTSELCLILPVTFLLFAASQDLISAGVRRVLPVLPILAISAGRLCTIEFSRQWIRPSILGLGIAWHGISSLWAFPHYIPYFNEFAGGRLAGPSLLDDSCVDWGQDLSQLKRVMDENSIPSVRLCYFGMADPSYYGIHYEAISTEVLRQPPPGVYAVSVHYLIRMKLRGVRWLTSRTPFAKAGTSIYLYRIP